MVVFRSLILVIALTVITLHSLKAGSSHNLRRAFHASVLKSDKIPEFLHLLEGIQNPNAVEEAYIGASKALMARETWNPIEKLVHIKNFREHLNNSIKKDQFNIEIRFLRYSIEYNIPKLFRSMKSVEEDKLTLLNQLSTISEYQVEKPLVNYIIKFLEDTNSCSQEEMELIKSRID